MYIYLLLLISVFFILYFVQRAFERRTYLSIEKTNIFSISDKSYLRIDILTQNDSTRKHAIDLSKLQVVISDERTNALRYAGHITFYAVNDARFMVQRPLVLKPKASVVVSIIFKLNEEYATMDEGYVLEFKETYFHIHSNVAV